MTQPLTKTEMEIFERIKKNMHDKLEEEKHHILDTRKGFWCEDCDINFNDEEDAEKHKHMNCKCDYNDDDIKFAIHSAYEAGRQSHNRTTDRTIFRAEVEKQTILATKQKVRKLIESKDVRDNARISFKQELLKEIEAI